MYKATYISGGSIEDDKKINVFVQKKGYTMVLAKTQKIQLKQRLQPQSKLYGRNSFMHTSCMNIVDALEYVMN